MQRSNKHIFCLLTGKWVVSQITVEWEMIQMFLRDGTRWKRIIHTATCFGKWVHNRVKLRLNWK